MNQNPKDPKNQMNPQDQKKQDNPVNHQNEKPSGKLQGTNERNGNRVGAQNPDSSRKDWEYPEESAFVKDKKITNRSYQEGTTKKSESPSRTSPDDEDYDEDVMDDELPDDDEEF